MLLAAVGLRHQQIVDIDAEAPGEGDVEGVLGIDEGRRTAAFLRLGHGVQGTHGLARRFGTEHLDDTTARQSADAQGGVERETTRGDDVDVDHMVFAQTHDGTLAKLLFHL